MSRPEIAFKHWWDKRYGSKLKSIQEAIAYDICESIFKTGYRAGLRSKSPKKACVKKSRVNT